MRFTFVDGDQIASVPLFFGANPAEVRHGPTTGQRTLPEEEDLGRALVRGLSPEKKKIAITSPTAFPDILTDKYRVANAFAPPRGLASRRWVGNRALLVRLLRHYVERTNGRAEWSVLAQDRSRGLDKFTFAWTGAEEPGQPHYYAIKAPSFLIEYDNTQTRPTTSTPSSATSAATWRSLLTTHYANLPRPDREAT